MSSIVDEIYLFCRVKTIRLEDYIEDYILDVSGKRKKQKN